MSKPKPRKTKELYHLTYRGYLVIKLDVPMVSVSRSDKWIAQTRTFAQAKALIDRLER